MLHPISRKSLRPILPEWGSPLETSLSLEISLGLESYDALGFNSQEELELEISKLIKIRPEFEINRE